MAHLRLGDRLVVRYRIDPEPETGPRLTDALGDLLAVEEEAILLATRRGPVRIPRHLIIAAKSVPPPPSPREGRGNHRAGAAPSDAAG